MNNPAFRSKPEAYILKTAIYAGLSLEQETKGAATGDQFLIEAEAAFKKYREMDPSMALLTDPVYQNAPINVYTSLFSSAYSDYDSKNWLPGFQKFKRVVEYADLLISKQIIPMVADTNSILLAGITPESAGLKDEAFKYYKRVADLRASGSGFEGIYRFLVNYYATKKDNVNFEKYRAIGKELYPESEYFKYDKVDFAVGLEPNFNKKLKALDEILAKTPNNQKALQLLGELIYDTLHSVKSGAVQPSNAAALEKKMINAFNKAAALKVGNEIPYLFIGEHFINKADKVNAAIKAHTASMKTRTQPGSPESKDDLAKKAALELQYSHLLEQALEPYKKAAAIFDKRENLQPTDKQQYKKVVGYLADIYTDKKKRAKGNVADKAKFADEEKKWNDKYDSIK